MEVTLQESTAANPEYADFLCASRPTAAGLFHRGWGVFLTLLLDAMGRQSVHQLNIHPCPHTPNTQDNSQPSVRTLIFKYDYMQKCGGRQKITHCSRTQIGPASWRTLKETHLCMMIRQLGFPDDRHLGSGVDGGTFSPQQDRLTKH